jgi:hypothetical protein
LLAQNRTGASFGAASFVAGGALSQLDKSVLHANVPLQIVSNSRKLSIKKAARSRLWEQ